MKKFDYNFTFRRTDILDPVHFPADATIEYAGP